VDLVLTDGRQFQANRFLRARTQANAVSRSD
jgi:hypothetical protein